MKLLFVLHFIKQKRLHFRKVNKNGCRKEVINIQFKDTSKLVMAICSSILKQENRTLIISPNEEKSNEAKLETEKLLQQGSVVGLDTYEREYNPSYKSEVIEEAHKPSFEELKNMFI